MAVAEKVKPLSAVACVQDLVASIDAQLRLTRRALALCQGGAAGGGPNMAVAAAVAAFAHAVEELKVRAHSSALEQVLPEAAQWSENDLAAQTSQSSGEPGAVLQPSEGGVSARTIKCSEESEAAADQVEPARGEEASQPSENGAAAQAGTSSEDTGTLARRGEDAEGATPARVPQLCSFWEALCKDDCSTPPRQQVSVRSFEHAHTMRAVSSGQGGRVGEINRESWWSARCIMMAPSSCRLLAWHVLSLVVLTWDLLTLPLAAFDFDELPINSVANLVTNVFWTYDLPFSFFVGYVEEGKLVVDLRLVAKQRVKWILPDLLIVVSDWCIYFLSSSDFLGLARMGKTFRLVRLLRFVRLARIVKFAHRFEELTDMVISETLVAGLNILKLLLCVIVFCHFGACAWFALGNLKGPEDQTSGWVSSWLHAQMHQELNFVHAYLVSFHWVFAQFTPAPPPSYSSPTNLVEEAGVVGLLLVGWMQFMFLMGSVNAHMQVAKRDASNRLEEQNLWRNFATEHKLPAYLFTRIQSFVTSRRGRHQEVVESDILALRDLPRSLLRELRLAVFSQVFRDHPLFQRLIQAHPSFVMDICYTAMRTRWLSKDDELFANRTPATKMYFVRTREKVPQAVLKFKAWSDHATAADLDDDDHQELSPNLQRAVTLIKEGTWFCEMTLWLGERTDGDVNSPPLHTGRAVALCTCSVAELDAPQFRSIAKSHLNVLRRLAEYASLFKENSQQPGFLPELWGTREECVQSVAEIFNEEAGADQWSHTMRSLLRLGRVR